MEKSEKKWLTALLLCWFLGWAGGQSWYAGKKTNAIIQLLTCGGCGIWTIIDLVKIVMKKYTDAEGKVICE